MQDIIKKYRKHKIFSNIILVLISLILAIGINITMIDGTEMGQNIKTSILDNNNKNQNNSDLYIKEINGILNIITSKDIKNIKNLSYSLIYNPENVKIKTINSDKGEIIKLNNSDGITSIIINYNKNTNIEGGNIISTLNITKYNNKKENINIINANFNDIISNETYLLSTSGITF